MSCKLGDKCDNVFACNILRPNVELLGCNFYKPKKPMTNEEWLRNASTEELAELIRKLVWCGTEIWQRFCAESEDDETDIKIVTEWLKEKHE